MTSETVPDASRAGEASLSIGEVADRAGIAVATLRMWEQRHGFPQASRLPSGHRRYTEADAALVREVLRHRDAGMRLDTAIAETLRSASPQPPSIYARLRRRNPALPTQRLRKTTLTAISWAIEDEFCAQAHAPELYGAFQRERFFDASRGRWEELALAAASATVFADFVDPDPDASPARIALAPGAPLRREWSIVCLADAFPVVLTAWELPGQRGVADRDREFEVAWSLDPGDVAEAAAVCREIARGEQGDASGYAGAPADVHRPHPAPPEPAAATALFARVVGYVDRIGR
ncbi:MerR family transcriptional regulator [Nocardioides sp. GY 10113]|uniref:DICT sensory domain-containing protein n=1 Tax=Nocardioides sp. GY 10113 TaxID=2569761 RepID=UPI0010A83BB9|nr:DICT sensory domain-containing protein [Nocardioides sp. GY 10113]TIC88342.1 MerR family transcriptional regulator [Nocardioides sp. GY 10113]